MHSRFALNNLDLQQHIALLAPLDAQHLHAGKQGAAVYAVIKDTGQAHLHPPLRQRQQKALPGVVQLGRQLVIPVALFLILLRIGLAQQLGIQSEQTALLSQLGLFLCRGRSPWPAQEVVADGCSEFFSTAAGAAAFWRAFW